MVSHVLSPVVLVLLALLPNEASCTEVSGGALASRLLQERMRHLHSLGSIMANMTVDSAFHVLQKGGHVPGSFVSLLQQQLGRASRAQLRTRAVQGPSTTAPPTDATSFQNARNMINDMIYEVQRKYEVEHRSCCEYEATRRSLIEEAAQDIALFNTEAAQARTGMLRAQGDITKAEQSIPQITASLKDHERKCDASIRALRGQLDIVREDIQTMTNVLAMTSCNPTQTQMSGLLTMTRCPHPCTGEASTVLGGKSLAHVTANLKSQEVRGLLNSTLTEAATWRPVGPAEALLQEQAELQLIEEYHATHAARQAQSARGLRHGQRGKQPQAPVFHLPGGPCTKPRKVDPKSSRCTLGLASCIMLQQRFLLIQAKIADQREELENEIRQQTESCKNMAQELRDQVNEQQRSLDEANSRLARWTSVQNRADEQNRLKTKERTTMEKEFSEMTATCHKNYQSFEEEECGLKKIRMELVKLRSQGGSLQVFVDCELTPWSPAPCSARCAGGTQVLRRTILTQPSGGVKCLPLTEVRQCNPQACPVNCRLGDWESWSSCTSACGGGVTQRGRIIEVKPKRGGEPCGEPVEVRSCNMQSCNQNCVLTQWTGWSQCTKQCGGGRRVRHRFVEKAATGSGSCWNSKSSERLQLSVCNTQPCGNDLICEAKLDVVLLLDGSGSLGEDGWAATKKAGQMLVSSLMGGRASVQVAVLLFSGPMTWAQVDLCTGADTSRQVDVMKDCWMRWVTRFNSTLNTTQEIEKLRWPQGSTLTSTALGLAEAELNNGRPGADAVVIVITDGRPLSEGDTTVMSNRLKRKARLVYVPVTDLAPLDKVREWASEPADQNVVVVNTFGELENRKTVDNIVSTMCPEVKPRSQAR